MYLSINQQFTIIMVFLCMKLLFHINIKYYYYYYYMRFVSAEIGELYFTKSDLTKCILQRIIKKKTGLVKLWSVWTSWTVLTVCFSTLHDRNFLLTYIFQPNLPLHVFSFEIWLSSLKIRINIKYVVRLNGQINLTNLTSKRRGPHQEW